MNVTRTMVKVLGTAAMTAVIGAATPNPAQAAMYLELYDGTTTITVNDGSGGDLNSNAGAITFIGSIGVWSINVSTGLSKPILPSNSNEAHLDLSTVNTSSGVGSLRITLYDDLFAPVWGSGGIAGATTNIGGTLGAGQSVVATTNVAGTPILPNLTFGPGGAFSGSTSGPVSGSGTFAMMLRDTITSTQGGVRTSSFDHTVDVSAVPEPASMFLLGSGLIAVARRRRAKK